MYSLWLSLYVLFIIKLLISIKNTWERDSKVRRRRHSEMVQCNRLLRKTCHHLDFFQDLFLDFGFCFCVTTWPCWYKNWKSRFGKNVTVLVQKQKTKSKKKSRMKSRRRHVFRNLFYCHSKISVVQSNRSCDLKNPLYISHVLVVFFSILFFYPIWFSDRHTGWPWVQQITRDVLCNTREGETVGFGGDRPSLCTAKKRRTCHRRVGYGRWNREYYTDKTKVEPELSVKSFPCGCSLWKKCERRPGS